MSITTPIEWCDSTMSPTTGCGGCEFWDGNDVRACSAGILHEGRLATIFPQNYAPDFLEVRMVPGRMKQAAAHSDLRGMDRPGKPWLNGRPRHILVSDMGDALTEPVTFEFLREEVLEPVNGEKGRRHVWIWLTKRPQRMVEFARWLREEFGQPWPDHLMAMVSVSCQMTAKRRIDWLLKVPAKWRGIHCEPLTGRLDLDEWLAPKDLPFPAVDWVVAGGGTGPQASPMHPDAPRALRDDCLAAGVPFFFKGFGAFRGLRDVPAKDEGRYSGERLADETLMLRVGRSAWRGRLLDGQEWNGMPSMGNGVGK